MFLRIVLFISVLFLGSHFVEAGKTLIFINSSGYSGGLNNDVVHHYVVSGFTWLVEAKSFDEYYYFDYQSSNTTHYLYDIKSKQDLKNIYEMKHYLKSFLSDRFALELIDITVKTDDLTIMIIGHGSVDYKSVYAGGNYPNITAYFKHLTVMKKKNPSLKVKFYYEKCFSESKIASMIKIFEQLDQFPSDMCAYATSLIQEHNYVLNTEVRYNVFQKLIHGDIYPHFRFFKYWKPEEGVLSFEHLQRQFFKESANHSTPNLSSEVYLTELLKDPFFVVPIKKYSFDERGWLNDRERVLKEFKEYLDFLKFHKEDKRMKRVYERYQNFKKCEAEEFLKTRKVGEE